VDTIPGHPSRMLLYADRPGAYRGQCAEFCGLQHANMAMEVVAQPPDQFRAWLANEAKPAAAAAGPGEQAFMSEQCASCHTIRGTAARGTIGPDLTHVGGRTSLAGLTTPNDPAHMAQWIANPQSVKPGARMPGLGLTPQEVRDLVSYLESLK
jgi:cytochrome c oxidase subunit II